MFHRVTISAADFGESERFYGETLPELGIVPTELASGLAVWDDFAIVAAGDGQPPTRHLHVGFGAPSRDHVDAFWRAGTTAGFEDDGAPGERPQYTPSYYGAFLRDPDGNSAEAVHHDDVRRGGIVDHLWIGVADLDAEVAFYASLMRVLGLREGRRWDVGQQFHGAWATFSLVADGRRPTEGLRLAFPAPDRETIEEVQATGTISPGGTIVESVLPIRPSR